MFVPKTVAVHNGVQVKVFNALCLETSALCNRTCVFCPNHNFTRPDEFMPMELIEKVIGELAAIKWKGRLSSYIYNEPMRDKRIYDIARLVSKELPSASFMVSTNGDYLKSADDVEALYQAGVRQLLVNIYSEDDAAKEESRRAEGVRKAEKRANQVQSWADSMDCDKEGNPYNHAKVGARIFRIERKYGVRPDDAKLGAAGKFELQNRSGNIEWFGPTLSEPISNMCVRPWRTFNVNWRGEAILCCNDYHGTTSVGNIKDRNIVDLWNDPKFHAYRLLLQNKRRDSPLCDTCDYGGGAYRHNVEHVTFGQERDAELLAMYGKDVIKAVG